MYISSNLSSPPLHQHPFDSLAPKTCLTRLCMSSFVFERSLNRSLTCCSLPYKYMNTNMKSLRQSPARILKEYVQNRKYDINMIFVGKFSASDAPLP